MVDKAVASTRAWMNVASGNDTATAQMKERTQVLRSFCCAIIFFFFSMAMGFSPFSSDHEGRVQKKREKLRRSHKKNETAVGVDPAVTHSSFLLLYRHELTPYSTLGPLLVVDFHRLPRRTHSWSSHRKPAQAAPCPACQSVALIRFRWQMPWSR